MWVHQELREVYRKAGWKETDFVTKTIAARNARPNSPTNLNSTLNRPMASQSGTRYEDRTMQRGAAGGGAIAAHMNNSAAGYMPEEVQMQNMSLYGGNPQQAMYAPHGNHMVRPGEPVYAQVNRDKKKNSRNHSDHPQMMMQYAGDYSEHADHWNSHIPNSKVDNLSNNNNTRNIFMDPQPLPQAIHGSENFVKFNFTSFSTVKKNKQKAVLLLILLLL